MSETPETDQLSPNVREPWSKFAVRCKTFAADMEKQRDAAREENANMRAAIQYAWEAMAEVYCPNANDALIKRATLAKLEPFIQPK